MSARSPNRDVIALGASAGGVSAVRTVLAGLPADLPAAVFVAVHIDASHGGHLADILGRDCALPVRYAMHGEPVAPGRVFVAPPDNHLMLRPGYLHVARGPKENGHRPAVDALFRTAASAYGSRVIAAVLTGNLDCGTVGALSVKARGGVVIAQDPAEAEAPSMPRSAIERARVDHVVRLAELAPLLARLAQEPAPDLPPAAPGAPSEIEAGQPGARAEFVCPTCQGVLTEAQIEGFYVLRCCVGHAFTLESIAAEHSDALERALWAAVRALDDSAALARRMAVSARGELARRYDERAATLSQQSEVIRSLLLDPAAVPAATVAP